MSDYQKYQDAGASSLDLANEQRTQWSELLEAIELDDVLEPKLVPVSYRVVILPKEKASISEEEYLRLIDEHNLPT